MSRVIHSFGKCLEIFFFFFSRYFIRDIKAKVTAPAPKELMKTGETNASNVRKSHFTLSALIEAHTECYVSSEKGDNPARGWDKMQSGKIS